MNRSKMLQINERICMLLLASIILIQIGPGVSAANANSYINVEFTKWCNDYRNKDKLAFCEEDCYKGLNVNHECELDLPFDFDGMSQRQRMYACDYYSPFGTKEVKKSSKGDLHCIYQTMMYCKKSQDVQIGNNCFRVSSSSSLQFKDAKCPNGYKMMTGKSAKENRWVTSLVQQLDGTPVWINGKGRNAMLTKTDGFMGEEVGTLVQFDEQAMIKRNIPQYAMCYTQATRIPVEQLWPDNKLEFSLTNNFVQPDGTPENPNVKKYHEYCNKVFPGSSAAYPDHAKTYMKDKKSKNTIVHVAGQIRQPLQIFHNSDCTAALPTSTVKKQYETMHIDGTKMGIRNDSFGPMNPNHPKYPNNKCSDTQRSVLTVHNSDKISGLVDEPAIARHRILCVRGNKLVPVEASSFCGDKAEPDSGAYDCKCKKEYIDALNVTTFKHKDKIRKGQLCFKSDCKTVTKSMHVILLIDISGSECGAPFRQAQNYLKQLPDIIPDHAEIVVIPWGSSWTVKGFMASDNQGILKYINEMPCGGGNEIDVIGEVRKIFKSRNADVKILISTADGMFEDWTHYCRELIKQNVNIISVHNGPYDITNGYPVPTKNMKGCVNPDKVDTNYIRIKSGDTVGMNKEHFQLVMSTQCLPVMINED